MGYPKREPDVEATGFRIWTGEKGKDYGKALIEIHEGEEVHESRVYQSPIVAGYSLLVFSKRKDKQYWVAVKGKRPNGVGFLSTEVKGPLSLEEYQEVVRRVEQAFALLFDTANPLVTPGKHYNLYMGRKKRSEGEC